MLTYRTPRREAMEWWKTLSTEEKVLYFARYRESNFTPARNHTELTGREIEIIFKNL